MISMIRLLLGSTLVIAPIYYAGADEKPPKTNFILYDGFKDDQAALPKTVRLKVTNAKTDTVNASSPEACQAARRIFERVSFLFHKRDEILRLLGDPATISDYNEKAKIDPNQPLEYVFDDGYGGWRYTLTFRNSECVGVKADGLY